MRVLIAADSLLKKTPDGTYWCNAIYGYDFWQRYIKVFDNITLISRCKNISFDESQDLLKVSGKGLEVIELPYMRKAKGYILNYKNFYKISKNAVKNYEYAIFRLPSVSVSLIWYLYSKLNKPFLVEVVADPKYAYSNNLISKKIFTHILKKAVRGAKGVSYVTEFYLQKKYPSSKILNPDDNYYFTTHYSSIDLDKSFLYNKKSFENNLKCLKIIHVSNHIDVLKGQKEAIDVVKYLDDLGYNIHLEFIGDGKLRSSYESLVTSYGLEDKIKFLGRYKDKTKIREKLIEADLMLFPTHAEGLPRVVIEAMAVSLPIITTNVNGIPELISENYLFHPNDKLGMAKKIAYLIDNPEELDNMAKINFANSKKYLNTELDKRRTNFYNKLIL